MSASRALRPAPTAPSGSATTVAPPAASPRNGTMLFKIVGPHRHRAVQGDRVFWCERETTTVEGRVSVRWSAFEGKTLLQGDCRTLNEAKKWCRECASDENRSQ